MTIVTTSEPVKADAGKIALVSRKCKRCGDPEYRIHGFCSCHCEDLYDVEQERDAWRSVALMGASGEMVEVIEARFRRALEVQHEPAS